MKLHYLVPVAVCVTAFTAFGQAPVDAPIAGNQPSASNAGVSIGVQTSKSGGVNIGGYGGSGGYGLGRGSTGIFIGSSGRVEVPPVVLRFSASDPSRTAALEEDLNVMTRLLQKALERGMGEDSPDTRMGIPLLYTGGSRSIRAMYLEGFGALCMIKVNFPVFAPAPAQTKEAPPAADSEWERARREVYGQNDEKNASPAESKYDPQQVNALKKILLQSLKNAANIRNVPPDEYVSLTVFGQPITMGGTKTSSAKQNTTSLTREFAQVNDAEKRIAELKAKQELSKDELEDVKLNQGAARKQLEQARRQLERAQMDLRLSDVYSWESGAGTKAGTVLTLRAKKADVDAFASGKLDFETFQKKTEQHAYVGSGHGLTSINSWAVEGTPRVR